MKDTTFDISQFPSTRYQGSKRKILPWIYRNLKDLDFHTVLDGFGGSASVSYLFKKMNKSVTYNDNLKFNSIIGKSIIENQNVKFTEEDVSNLLNNTLESPDLIKRLFKDIYYLESENIWLDNISNGILNMNHYTGITLEYKKALAYYALFQACLAKRPFNLFHRKNLNIRTADVVRNFGNKKTWEKDFAVSFKSFVHEANSRVFNSQIPCYSINQSIFDIDHPNYDLVYLDPPYVNKEAKNETSNYLNCYHFLEGIVNYNDWEQKIDFNTATLRFKNEKEESFCKENIKVSFEMLFEKFRDSIIVVSYKKGGIPSIQYLVNLMKKYKKNVTTRSQHYIYALNKQNGDAQKNREVLIIGT